MRYTIELDNGEGRGEIKLIDGIICVITPQDAVQSTGIASTADTLDTDISDLYNSPVWRLQKKGTTLKQYEARARQGMIISLINNIRCICGKHGRADYYRRLQEMTTCDIIKTYLLVRGTDGYDY